MNVYDLNLPGQLILTNLIQGGIISQTFSFKKDVTQRGGQIGQGVDVYANILRGVQTRTYTKANKNANANYVFDNFTLTPVNIRLTDELYAGVSVDGWDNLFFDKTNVTDFAFEINHLSNLLVDDLENASVAALEGLNGVNAKSFEYLTTTSADRGAEIIAGLVDLSLDFNKNKVAVAGRTAVVGRNIYKHLLETKAIQSAANTGEAGESAALREATVGKIATFNIVQSDLIGADTIAAYSAEAFIIVSRAPGKNVAAAYSELVSLPTAPIDLRINVVSRGDRNATGLLVSTFFTVAELKGDQAENYAAKKLTFTSPAETPAA